MSCEVAALPFQAHANYGTWSIDFDYKVCISVWFSTKSEVSEAGITKP